MPINSSRTESEIVKLFFAPTFCKSEVAEVAVVVLMLDDDEGTKLAVVGRNNGAFISLRPSKFWDMNESIFGFSSLPDARDDLKRCLGLL